MTKPLYIVTDRDRLIDFLAEGIIRPPLSKYQDATSFPMYESKPSSNELTKEDGYFKVAMEIDRKFISFAKKNKMLSVPSPNPTSIHSFVTYIPLYYAKSLIFCFDEEQEDFRVRKFSNADTEFLPSEANLEFFTAEEEQKNQELDFAIKSYDEDSHPEMTPPLDVSIQNKIMGGFSVLINNNIPRLSPSMGFILPQISSLISGRKIKKGNDFLFINQAILDFIYSGNFPDLINSRPTISFEEIIMASLSRVLAKLDPKETTMNKELILSAFDDIPQGLLKEEDALILLESSKFIESVMDAGNNPGSLSYADEGNIVLRAALYTLTTRAKIDFMLSEERGEQRNKVGIKVLCTALFFSGLFEGFSRLSLRYKGSTEHQSVSSLAFSSLIGAKISSHAELNYKSDGVTAQLFVQKEPLSEEIELSDPHLKSIVLRAEEANYHFIPRDSLFYCSHYSDGDEFDIVIERVSDNFFGKPVVRFSALLEQKIPSQSKVVELQSNYDNRGFVTKIEGSYAVSVCQLILTADFDEVESAIKDVIEGRKKLLEMTKL